MEETIEKKVSAYKEIIWSYIDAVNTQMNIVPVSYNFLSAQLLTESGQGRTGGTDTVLKTKLFGLKVRHFNNSCLLIAFTRSIHALFSM